MRPRDIGHTPFAGPAGDAGAPHPCLAAWPDADRRTRIVFIVKDLEERFVSGLYAAFAGVPAVDAPDRAALLDSPLAPRSGGLFD